MRCSDKSTTWRASAWIGAVVLLASGAAGPRAETLATPADHDVREAIIRAVRARMGAGVEVAVDDLRVRGDLRVSGDPAGVAGIVATLDPSARLGVPIRVGLKVLRGRTRAVRVGEAECRVRVTASYLEVVAPLARGEVVTAGAVRRLRGSPEDVPMQPLPTDVTGARTVRPLAPGDLVRHRDVLLPAAVRTGDTVLLRVTVDAVMVTLDAVAAQDGRIGDRIRVVNPSSGRALRGTVVAAGEIEVHHGS